MVFSGFIFPKKRGGFVAPTFFSFFNKKLNGKRGQERGGGALGGLLGTPPETLKIGPR